MYHTNNNFSIYGRKSSYSAYNFYSECDNMYERDIMNLREIVDDESLFTGYGIDVPDPVFVTNLINKINSLMRKMRICCHYQDNKLYIMLEDLLKHIECYKEKNLLQAEIDRLKTIVQGAGVNAQSFSEVKIDTVIKSNYIKYIIHFGFPEDGIFSPALLAAVECME